MQIIKEQTEFIDRNQNIINTGDIVKYRKVCGGDFIFVVIKRNYDRLNIENVTEFGLHRQGFYEDFCCGCWDYTELAKEDYTNVKKSWDEATEDVKSQYEGFEDYADRYCVEVVGNIFEGIPVNKFAFGLDPQYR